MVVDGTLPARDAFRIANADFHVEGRPVFDADMNKIPGYQAPLSDAELARKKRILC